MLGHAELIVLSYALLPFHISLTKLMVSHDLQHSTAVTNQITFYGRHSHSTPEFDGAVDLRCQALVSKLETLDIITFASLMLVK